MSFIKLFEEFVHKKEVDARNKTYDETLDEVPTLVVVGNENEIVSIYFDFSVIYSAVYYYS